MKGMRILLGTVVVSAFVVSLAFANPAMLPKHPGYPAKGKSPATGQATANDPGQRNADGSKVLPAAASFNDADAMNTVNDPNRDRIRKSMGAGRLPHVDSMNKVSINPAGATSTVIK